MRTVYPLILAGICLGSLGLLPVQAAPVSDCAGGVEVAHAKIVRVEKNGALILDDGRAVMLEGVRLPLTDHGPSGLADDSLSALRALALAEPLMLTATPPKEDRYDRVRVQAFGTVWIQTELLKRGLARVEVAPDRQECAADFYAAERDARKAGRGLWAFPTFAIRKPASLSSADAGSFQIVEGAVTDVSTRDGRTVLNFGADSHHVFAAVIAPDDHKAFRNTRPAIEEMAGHTVRLRGVVEDDDGHPALAVANPAQIEFLQ